jgi:transcriptional regulator with XRE-family HTH domain
MRSGPATSMGEDAGRLTAVDQRRLQLAHRLRDLRRAAGLSQAQLAERIGTNRQMVGHYEVGRYVPTVERLDRLVATLGLSGDDRADLQDRLAELEAHVRSIRARLRQGGARAVQDEVAAEEQSGTLQWCYQAAIVPGLLQTPDYTRAMVPLLMPELGADLDGLVAGRAARQQVLYDRNKALRFLLHESALRARVASVPVLRGQLNRLLSLIEALPHVEVRGLPFATLLPAWSTVSFDIVDDLVEVELLSSSVVIADRREVALYRDRFERLWTLGLEGKAMSALVGDVDAWLAELPE